MIIIICISTFLLAAGVYTYIGNNSNGEYRDNTTWHATPLEAIAEFVIFLVAIGLMIFINVRYKKRS